MATLLCVPKKSYDSAYFSLIIAELQIREGLEDNSKIIFLLSENICCDPSLEPSRDDSNDGSQNIFYGEIWLIIFNLSLLPILIWNNSQT